LPDEEGPKSFVRSTLIVRIFPSTVISTFFMNCFPILCDEIIFVWVV
jgi:hypothetical protein